MPQKIEDDLDLQARILTRYFVRNSPSPTIQDLYSSGVAGDKAENIGPKDAKLLRVGFSHPFLLPLLDAGLAVLNPYAELRRRTYIMFAILESMPEYSDRFLAKKRNPLYVLVIGLISLRAVLRAISGVVIIKALRV